MGRRTIYHSSFIARVLNLIRSSLPLAYQVKKATDFKNQLLSNWWAHLDSNQGPKDYEQLKEIKTYINQ